MTERRLWTLFGILVLSGLVGGLVLGQPRRLHPKLASDLPAPRDQPTERRTLTRPPLERVAQIPAAPAGPLGRPLLVQAGGDGTAWIFDFADMALERVSRDGAVDVVLGGGATGDRLFRNPTGLFRSPNGDLWLPDPAAGSLFVVAKDGTLRRSVSRPTPAIRWVVSPSGRSFALTPMTRGTIFQAYDEPGGRAVASFGRLFEPRYQMPYTLDGALAADPRGGIVYAPRYVGLLIGYRPDGGLRFVARTLEAVGPPVLVSDNGRLRGDRSAPVSTVALRVVGRTILAVHPVETPGGGAFVDLYSSVDGRYERSWKADRTWSDFDVYGDSLYAVSADGLTIFRLTGEAEL